MICNAYIVEERDVGRAAIEAKSQTLRVQGTIDHCVMVGLNISSSADIEGACGIWAGAKIITEYPMFAGTSQIRKVECLIPIPGDGIGVYDGIGDARIKL